MRKRIVSLAAAAALAVSALSLQAFAQGGVPKIQYLPFGISEPKNVVIRYLEGRDSLNTCEIAYSQSEEMSEWASRYADELEHDKVIKELEKLGLQDAWITAQIDWSLDSQDDWKCDQYWTTGGYDSAYVQHLGDWAYTSANYSPEITNTEWIFRGMGNANDPEDAIWNGFHGPGGDYKGWKDVLKTGQYSLVTTEDGEKHAKIDFQKHTLYTRVRWLVTLRPDQDGAKDSMITSPWSEVAAVGKDAEKIEPIKAEDLDAPAISNLHYTDKESGNYPVIGFKLDVTDKLSKQLAQASGTQGYFRLKVEARLKGAAEWTELHGDFEIKAGDMELALQTLAEKEGNNIKAGTPIQLRARYECFQTGLDDIYSPWTTLTFSAEVAERIAGDNRYGTAAEIAKAAFPSGAETVVLANGLTFADALAGVPLAANLKAPILLAATNSLPRETTNAIEKLGAKKVIILGGESAISKKVEKTLEDNKLTVTRLAGDSRFGTATAIADELNKEPEEIFFVWALNAADALSVGGVAATKNAPIIYLTTKGKLNADTEAYLKTVKGKVKNAYVIGGESVIDNDMMKQAGDALGLKAGETITRVAGKNRYETCVAVNTTFASVLTGTGICVAKGLDFPDALAGGVYAAVNKEPLFLADGSKLQECQSKYLKAKKATRLSVFGGIGAVPDNLVRIIENAGK